MRRSGGVTILLSAVVIVCLACPASGAVLALDWKKRPPTDNPFEDPLLSDDGSTVFAGGSQLLLRSWDNERHFGGLAGFIASMSGDGRYILSSMGERLQLVYWNGEENWTRMQGGTVRCRCSHPEWFACCGCR